MPTEYIPNTKIIRPTVKLIGSDGNAYALMGRVQRALRGAGAPKEVIKEFLGEAMSGDYDHLITTICNYVDVDEE